MIPPTHPLVSVPALASGNQIDGGFYKGFFRSLLNVYGYSAAQTLVEVLNRCGMDLSRENVMRQAINLDMDLPLLLPGAKVHTTPTDRYPIKNARIVRFEGDHWAVLRE